MIGEDVKPQLYIGSTEDDGSNAKDIYLNIMSTPWLQGHTDIIGGIYYGHEDSEDLKDMEDVSDFIHGQGKKMIWIPYIDEESRTIKDIIEKYALAGDDENPLFDTIIIQPGAFYNNKKYLEGVDYLEEIKQAIMNYDNKNARTKLGIEMEFDMGVVTGRRNGNIYMTYLDKRRVLIDYLRVFDELNSLGTPIGVYSGGPNEQGYNDIRMNRNTHNSGNHIPYWEGIDESAYAYGVYYEHFADKYVGGNAIYDLNNYLYNGIWSPALTDSLWLDPR